MADGFIVRRGGAGGGLQALAPTINIVEIGFTDITFTITNNDPQKGIVRYRLDDIEDLGEIIEVDGNTTSDSIFIDGLDENTSYTIFANTNVTEKVKSETVEDSFTTNFIEEGLIVMWFGQSNEVPSGFALCDGTNGTPDLRNRFIIGAGDEYSIGNTGGNANAVLMEHSHSASLNTSTVTNHAHPMDISSSGGNNSRGVGVDQVFDSGTVGGTGGGAHTHVIGNLSVANNGSSPTNANLPPYRSLFYIIKEAI